MRRKLVRRMLFAGLFLAFLLHNDLWLWNDPRIVWGLPVGLTYHVAYCIAVSALMGLLVRLAWPFERGEAGVYRELDEPDARGSEARGDGR